VVEVLLECHVDVLGELHILEHPLQLEGEYAPALQLNKVTDGKLGLHLPQTNVHESAMIKKPYILHNTEDI
jgi:hypothetical protein